MSSSDAVRLESDAVRLAKILDKLGLSQLDAVGAADSGAFGKAAYALDRIFRRLDVRSQLESMRAEKAQQKWLSKTEAAARTLANLLEEAKNPIAAQVEDHFDARVRGLEGLATTIRGISLAAEAVAKKRRERQDQPAIPKTPDWSPTDRLVSDLAAWYRAFLKKPTTTKLVDGQKGGSFVEFVRAAAAAWDRKKPSGSAIAEALQKAGKRARRL